MRQRLPIYGLVLAALIAAGFIVVFMVRESKHEQLPAPDVTDPGEAELWLSTEPPQGRWANPEVEAHWVEWNSGLGVNLSRRPERGPIRCHLRVIPGAAAAGRPELAVDLTNASDAPVVLNDGHQILLDYVTFILRDPDGQVVSTFCYAPLHSIDRQSPAVVIRPGGTETAAIYLTVAADHGFLRLRPGRYTLEAVFRDEVLLCSPEQDQRMLARSNRLAIRVSDPGG